MNDFLKDREEIQKPVDNNKEKLSGFRSFLSTKSQPTQTVAREGQILKEVLVDKEGLEKEPPKVELLTERGEVKRIIVSCSCGEHLEIECIY